MNRQAYGAYISHFNRRVEALANDLSSGNLTVQQWRNAMQQEVERIHVTAELLGRGGTIEGLSNKDLRRVRRQIGEQLGYLDRWADELRGQRNKGEELNPAALTARAKMYGRASSATLQQATAASVGVELPFMPGQKTSCLSNCGCAWDIRKLDGDGNFDAFWRRHKDDSCDQCIAREKACNPLRIRNWKTQPFPRAGTVT